MTIQDALDRIDALKPNMVPADIKVRWLSEIDEVIQREIIKMHYDGPMPPRPPHRWPGDPLDQGAAAGKEEPESEEEREPYDPEATDTELLVPFPYDKLYQHYLAMQLDIVTAEIEKYNNDAQLFTAAYTEYQDWYNRHHYPVQRVPEFKL